ncbi:Hypothetical_protein [Hexamita inflata]|uniref:Hypothetical_protein n=1 Tax=Hexamita inflata TaxID=28002 RepID=A0ABP1GSD5_9EUKA
MKQCIKGNTKQYITAIRLISYYQKFKFSIQNFNYFHVNNALQEELQYINRLSWAMIRTIHNSLCTDDTIRESVGRDLKDMICEFVSNTFNENIMKENFWHSNEEKLVYDQNNRNITGQGRTKNNVQKTMSVNIAIPIQRINLPCKPKEKLRSDNSF